MEEKLDMMYKGTVANGSLMYNSNSAILKSNNSKGKNTTMEEILDESSNESQKEPPQRNKGECSVSKRPRDRSPRRASKRKGGASILQPDLADLASAIRDINTNLPHGVTTVYSVADVLTIMDGIPGLTDDWELYMNSVRIMEKPIVRELFMTIAPANRLRFLKHYNERP